MFLSPWWCTVILRQKMRHKEEQWLCNISDFVVLCLFHRNCEGRNIRYRTCSNTVSQCYEAHQQSVSAEAGLHRIGAPVVYKIIQIPHTLHVRLLDSCTNVVIDPVTSKSVALTAPFNSLMCLNSIVDFLVTL